MAEAIGIHAGPDSVVIGVSGALDGPEVAGRWNLCLVDRNRPELAQPYHAAAEILGVEAGRARIKLCEDAARHAADGIIGQVLAELGAGRHRPSAAGLVLGAGRLAGTLEEILRSHIQLHMAEGEMLRTALREAAQARGLRVVGRPERGLAAQVADLAGLPEAELTRRLAAIGKQLGPPWTKRQQHACLVGWAALAGPD